MELPCDLVVPLGIYQKEMKSVCQRDLHTPTSITALFTTAKVWKHSQGASTDDD